MEVLERELLKFPVGRHDDAVDALSGAVALINNKSLNREREERPHLNAITRENLLGRRNQSHPRELMGRSSSEGGMRQRV